MGLLDLIQQHHRIRPAPHGLGEVAALFVAHIARRRADQAGHGVLLHELRHVDAHDGVIAVEQELGQRLAQLGLADARGAQKQERTIRATRIRQPGARTTNGIGDDLQRLGLTDDALGQRLFHAQ